jgi:glycosyltransferase involved in cell wall biosynthesis
MNKVQEDRLNTGLRVGVNALFYLPGEVGGSETYLLETLRALSSRAEAPNLVLFANVENRETLRAEYPCAEVVETGIVATRRTARILAEQIQLPRLVKRARIDVLWSPGYTAPLGCECPQVVSILDMQYKRFPQDVSWLAARTMDFLYPASARRSDAVVTISEFAKSEAEHFLGLPPDKITVTLLAADPGFGAPCGLPPRPVQGAPYLLCVAHTYPHKNVAMLVRTFNRMAADIPHRLVLVGKARFGEPEVETALKSSLPGRVIRFAHLARRDLMALYQSADWFVFPSLYEGFGLPVLEAMTAGVPVLTTREGSIPEIGGDGVRYADGRDEMAFSEALRAAVALPPADRAHLIAAGQKRANGFTWAASAGQLLRVLAQVAADGRRGFSATGAQGAIGQ